MATLSCYIVLTLLSTLFYQRAEAIFVGVNRVLIAYSEAYDSCKEVTQWTGHESRLAADRACEQAFEALDQATLNTCYGWRHAGCRPILGTADYRCTCLISISDYRSIKSHVVRSFRDCAPFIKEREDATGQTAAPTANFLQTRRKYDDALEFADLRRVYGSYLSECGAGGAGYPSGVYTSEGAGGLTDLNTLGLGNLMYAPGSSSGLGRTDGRRRAARPVPRPCDQCDSHFRSARALFDHKRTHHHVGDTHCYTCNLPCDSRKSFLAHLYRRHPELLPQELATQNESLNPAEVEAVLPVPCPFCTRRFSSKHNMSKHLRSHTTDDTRCRLCNKVFSTRQSLISHMRYTHPRDPIPEPGPVYKDGFVCDVCRKSYTTRNALRDHKKSHSTLDTYCLICDKTLASRASYRRHMEAQHKEIADSEAAAAIEQYVAANPEKCEKCDKRFKNPRGLRDHMKQHDGKTTCDKCNQVFSRTRILAAHKKRRHPD